MKKTFEAEFDFFKSNLKMDYKVLDVGCGVGRPANALAPLCKEIIGIENDTEAVAEAEKRCQGIDNLKILDRDALDMGFEDNSFDLVYATYNLIGSIKKEERQPLVNEMVRVAKLGAKIINITWKRDNKTTEFLRQYYPSIGIDIVEIDNTKRVSQHYTLECLSKEQLLNYYKAAGLKDIKFKEIGPVWLAIIGIK